MAFACWKKRKLGYGGGPIVPAPSPIVAPPASVSANWRLGPVINGQNYSVGMVCDPVSGNFSWPVAAKGLDRWLTPGPHYLTKPCNGIQGRAIRVAYQVTGDGKFFGSVGGQSAVAYLCVFFQAAGDDWSGTPGQVFRWWSNEMFPLTPGVHHIEVPLSREDWIVWPGPGDAAQFEAAKSSAANVGLTFGNDEGRGHGVSSETGGSAFALVSFEVVA